MVHRIQEEQVPTIQEEDNQAETQHVEAIKGKIQQEEDLQVDNRLVVGHDRRRHQVLGHSPTRTSTTSGKIGSQSTKRGPPPTQHPVPHGIGHQTHRVHLLDGIVVQQRGQQAPHLDHQAQGDCLSQDASGDKSQEPLGWQVFLSFFALVFSVFCFHRVFNGSRCEENAVAAEQNQP